MKVTGTGPASGPKRTEKTRKTQGGSKAGKADFTSHLDSFLGEAGEVHAADVPHAVAGVESIFAAQTVTDSTDPEARRRMAQRGEEILARLDELRHGLLLGSVSKERLLDIARMVRQKRETGADPRLSAILDEIELRAQVELAKLTRRS